MLTRLQASLADVRRFTHHSQQHNFSILLVY